MYCFHKCDWSSSIADRAEFITSGSTWKSCFNFNTIQNKMTWNDCTYRLVASPPNPQGIWRSIVMLTKGNNKRKMESTVQAEESMTVQRRKIKSLERWFGAFCLNWFKRTLCDFFCIRPTIPCNSSKNITAGLIFALLAIFDDVTIQFLNSPTIRSCRKYLGWIARQGKRAKPFHLSVLFPIVVITVHSVIAFSHLSQLFIPQT